MNARVLVVFVDGVGLGPDDPGTNPVAAASLPAIRTLLDGALPLLTTPPGARDRATLVGIDATLGVDGMPQSGTGHATLLTGRDAVRLFGRHYGPWVPTALRPVVAEEGLLARAKAAGARVAFANAYPEELVERAREQGVRGRRLGQLRAGPPLAALGAGVLDRHTTALERGAAVSSEIVNDGWIQHLGRTSLPRLSPESAGENLSRIAGENDLTLFAHYTTDLVGHRGTPEEAVAAMERVDSFLAGILEVLPDDVLLLVVSDHGNLEDVRCEHTRNPALGLVVGRGHPQVAGRIRDLTDITPAVLDALGV
ncbi:MAG TPA: alkaline phosphatase family protein [Longimicrobiales bacterium]|nr:alkaline phosphatase family protein [Longimicrobiales bacterium]